MLFPAYYFTIFLIIIILLIIINYINNSYNNYVYACILYLFGEQVIYCFLDLFDLVTCFAVKFSSKNKLKIPTTNSVTEKKVIQTRWNTIKYTGRSQL